MCIRHSCLCPIVLTPPQKTHRSIPFSRALTPGNEIEDTYVEGIFSVTSWPKGKIVTKLSLMQNGGSLFPLEGLPSWAEWRQHVRCFSVRFTRLSSLSVGNPPQPPKHRVPTPCCQGERHLPFSEQTYRVQ